LVNLAATTRALIDHADNWLLSQPSIINKRRKSFVPVVGQRQSLCDGLSRLLQQLGLERRAKPVAAIPQTIVQPHDWEQEDEPGSDSPVDEPTAKDAKRSEDANEKSE
ncbi:MAG: hypothetical protein WA766_07640, partial [Candidatus Acidiferrales bacterium]